MKREYEPPFAHRIDAGEGVALEGNYGVYFADNLCGKVQVRKQGLYYLFVCRCQLSGDVICCLKAVFPGEERKLGILVPMDGGFGLQRKVPVKHFDGKPLRFIVSVKGEESAGLFAPIYPDEPFMYIEKLKDGYLARKNKQIGAVFPG